MKDFIASEKFLIGSNGQIGGVTPNAVDDIIKWNGSEWIAGTNPGGSGGGGGSSAPDPFSTNLISGQSIQGISFGQELDSAPSIATDLEIDGDGSIIPYTISGLSTTGYTAIFAKEIPNNNYKIHTVFGGGGGGSSGSSHWQTGVSDLYYNDKDVSIQRDLTIGGNLTVNGTQTIVNTETVEIEDHNLVIGANTHYTGFANPYPGAGDAYAGILWGTGDAGAASPVSLTYQSNKGFAFEGGNVGIGTTSPSEKLEVKAPIMSVFRGINDVGLSNGIRFKFGDSASTAIAQSYASIGGVIENNTAGSHSGGLAFSTAKNGNLTIAEERMRIDSNGNVGIGTTSPDYNLSVVSDTDPAKIGIHGYGSFSDGTVAAQLLFLGKDSSGRNRNLGYIQVREHAHTSGTGSMEFFTRIGGNENARMTIDSTGNVGIGTTSPDTSLHISTNSPSIRLTDTTPATDTVSQVWADSDDVGALLLAADITDVGTDPFISLRIGGLNQASEKMRIDSGGNVGIGTASPNSALHIEGGTNSTSQIRLKNYNNTDDISDFYITPIYNANQLQIRDGSGTSLMTVDGADGNVGIGNTSPSHPLTILSPTTAGTTTRCVKMYRGAGDLNQSLEMGYNGITVNRDDAVLANPQSNFSIKQKGSDGERTVMHVDTAGNIGIGTVTPDLQLDVNGGIQMQGDQFWFKGGAFRFVDRYSGSSAERMRIDSNGNVGIGTTSPGTKLDVIGRGKFDSLIGNNGLNLASNGANNLNLYHGIFGSTAALGVSIASDGYVGIGTTSPGSYKLNVNGDVFANSYTPTSDDRVKHNEQPIVGALETLSKITPKKYIKTVEMYEANHDFELDAGGNPVDSDGEPVEHRIEAGVIAQQVLTVDELAFAVSPEGVDEDGVAISPHGLDYNSLFTYAIAAIQEQQQLIDDLKSQNESLAARISALES